MSAAIVNDDNTLNGVFFLILIIPLYQY